MPEYLTITQAANEKKCIRHTIYRWINKNLIDTEIIAGKKLVVKNDKYEAIHAKRQGGIKKEEYEALRSELLRLRKENDILKKQNSAIPISKENLAYLAVFLASELHRQIGDEGPGDCVIWFPNFHMIEYLGEIETNSDTATEILFDFINIPHIQTLKDKDK